LGQRLFDHKKETDRTKPGSRGWKRRTVFAVWGVLAGLMLCGCSRMADTKLEHPYSFDERPFVLEEGAVQEPAAVPLFAQNLCVVSDESSYNPEDVDSEAGLLCDLSGSSVLYSKNAFERLYPASTTKIMTALIAIKYGNLDDMVTVTEDAVISEAGATLCGIQPGDVLTMRQLLYGLMLPSGNDAGAAIAVHMSESIEAFAELMNEEARRVGATGTHFVNPHGLHNEDHYTTAYDLYLIFQEALKYPEFREVTKTTVYAADYKDGNGNQVSKTWEGGNWYLTGQRETPEGLTVFSGKTGTTQAAGCCLVMAVRTGEAQEDGENEYVSVIMKAGNRNKLYDNMTNIISKIVN